MMATLPRRRRAAALPQSVPNSGLPGDARGARVTLLCDREHYASLVERELPEAQVAVWIATANLKELHIQAPLGTRARARGRCVSSVDLLGSLVDRGVDVRILHGREPSGPFKSALNRLRRGKLKLRLCPRVHMKTVTVDGRLLYLGSANFTGAGLGVREQGRRNFELGILTDDEYLLDRTQRRFDDIWSGRECAGCKLRSRCPKPIDTLDQKR